MGNPMADNSFEQTIDVVLNLGETNLKKFNQHLEQAVRNIGVPEANVSIGANIDLDDKALKKSRVSIEKEVNLIDDALVKLRGQDGTSDRLKSGRKNSRFKAFEGRTEKEIVAVRALYVELSKAYAAVGGGTESASYVEGKKLASQLLSGSISSESISNNEKQQRDLLAYWSRTKERYDLINKIKKEISTSKTIVIEKGELDSGAKGYVKGGDNSTDKTFTRPVLHTANTTGSLLKVNEALRTVSSALTFERKKVEKELKIITGLGSKRDQVISLRKLSQVNDTAISGYTETGGKVSNEKAIALHARNLNILERIRRVVTAINTEEGAGAEVLARKLKVIDTEIANQTKLKGVLITKNKLDKESVILSRKSADQAIADTAKIAENWKSIAILQSRVNKLRQADTGKGSEKDLANIRQAVITQAKLTPILKRQYDLVSRATTIESKGALEVVAKTAAEKKVTEELAAQLGIAKKIVSQRREAANATEAVVTKEQQRKAEAKANFEASAKIGGATVQEFGGVTNTGSIPRSRQSSVIDYLKQQQDSAKALHDATARSLLNTTKGTKAYAEHSKAIRDVEARQTDLRQALIASNKSMSGFRSITEQAGATLRLFFRYAIGYGALFQMLGAVKALIGGLVELDDKLKSIRAVSGATADEMVGIGAAIKSVAVETQFNVAEIADAAQTLAQAGVDPGDMASALQNVALFASTTNSTLETSADLISTMRNVFTDLSDRSIADQLTKAVNISKLTSEDLKTILSRGLQVANAYNISSDQFLSAVTVLRNAGIKASTVATGLRQSILELMTPDAKTIKALEARYTALGEGMSQDAIKSRFSAFASAANPLLSVLTEMKRLGADGSGSSVFDRVFDVRAQNVINVLLKDLGSLEGNLAALATPGAAADGARQQMMGFTNSAKNLGAAILNLSDSIGGNLVTSMSAGMRGLTEFTKQLTDTVTEIKAASGAGIGTGLFAGLAVAAKTVVSSGGSLPSRLVKGAVAGSATASGVVAAQDASPDSADLINTVVNTVLLGMGAKGLLGSLGGKRKFNKAGMAKYVTNQKGLGVSDTMVGLVAIYEGVKGVFGLIKWLGKSITKVRLLFSSMAMATAGFEVAMSGVASAIAAIFSIPALIVSALAVIGVALVDYSDIFGTEAEKARDQVKAAREQLEAKRKLKLEAENTLSQYDTNNLDGAGFKFAEQVKVANEFKDKLRGLFTISKEEADGFFKSIEAEVGVLGSTGIDANSSGAKSAISSILSKLSATGGSTDLKPADLKRNLTELSFANQSAKKYIESTTTQIQDYILSIDGDTKGLSEVDLGKYKLASEAFSNLEKTATLAGKIDVVTGFMEGMASLDLSKLTKGLEDARTSLAKAEIDKAALNPSSDLQSLLETQKLGNSGTAEDFLRLQGRKRQLTAVANVSEFDKFLGKTWFGNATSEAAAYFTPDRLSALALQTDASIKRNGEVLAEQNDSVIKMASDIEAARVKLLESIAKDPKFAVVAGDTKGLVQASNQTITKVDGGRDVVSLSGESKSLQKSISSATAKYNEYKNRVAEASKIFAASVEVTKKLNDATRGVEEALSVADYAEALRLTKVRNQAQREIIAEEISKLEEANSNNAKPEVRADNEAKIEKLDSKLVKLKTNQVIAYERLVKSLKIKELKGSVTDTTLDTSELNRQLKNLDKEANYQEYKDILAQVNSVARNRLALEAEINLLSSEDKDLAVKQNSVKRRFQLEDEALTAQALDVAKSKIVESEKSLAIAVKQKELNILEYEANKGFNPEALPEIYKQRYALEQQLLANAAARLESELKALKPEQKARAVQIARELEALGVRSVAAKTKQLQEQSALADRLKLDELNRQKRVRQVEDADITRRLSAVSGESNQATEQSLLKLKDDNLRAMVDIDAEIAAMSGVKKDIVAKELNASKKALDVSSTAAERAAALELVDGNLANFKIANARNIANLEQKKVKALQEQNPDEVATIENQILDYKVLELQAIKRGLVASKSGATADQQNEIDRQILKNSQLISDITNERANNSYDAGLAATQRNLSNANKLLSDGISKLEDELSSTDGRVKPAKYKQLSESLLAAKLSQLDLELLQGNLKGAELEIAKKLLETSKARLRKEANRDAISQELLLAEQQAVDLARQTPDEVRRGVNGTPDTNKQIAVRNLEDTANVVKTLRALESKIAGDPANNTAENAGKVKDLANELVRLQEESRLAGRSLDDMVNEGYSLDTLQAKFEDMVRSTKSLSNEISDNLISAIDKIGDAFVNAVVDGGNLIDTLKSILYETATKNVKDYLKNIYNKAVGSIFESLGGTKAKGAPEDIQMTAAEMQLKAAEINAGVTGSTNAGNLANVISAGGSDNVDQTSGEDQGFFSGIYSKLTGVFDSLFGSEGSGVMNTIGNAFKGLFNSGSSVMSAIGSGLSSLFGSTASGSSGGGGGLMSSLVSIGTSLFASDGMVLKGKFSQGGILSGKGTATSDEIPALLTSNGKVTGRIALSNQEAILNAKAVRNLGAGTINAINKGHITKGSLGSVSTGATGNISARPVAQAAPPEVNASTRIINVTDPAMAQDFMESSSGERVIVNAIKRNSGSIKQLIG